MSNDVYDAIVVGAGLAGTTAARDLTERSARVLLLEATNRCGGRTFSRKFSGREELIECGGAYTNTDLHPQMATEVRRYGIRLKDDISDTGTKRFLTGGKLRSLPIPFWQAGKIVTTILHTRKASRKFVLNRPVHEQDVREFDVSGRDFFAPLKLPLATQDFFYAFLAAFTGAHPDSLSMLSPVSKVAGFGYSPMGLFSGQAAGTSPSKMFENGSNEVVASMIRDARINVRLASPVVRVDQRERSVTVVTAAGDSFEGKNVVVAVPTNVIRKIEFAPELSPEKRRLLAQDHIGMAYKVHLIADGVPRWPVALGMGAFQMILPMQELTDGKWLLAGFGCEGVAPMNPLDKGQVEAALRTYFPSARVHAVDGHDWTRDPHHNGTYRMDRPGAAFDMTRIMNTPEGRVIFGGGDIDDSVWRVSMEGAVNSGHRCASHVLSRLGL